MLAFLLLSDLGLKVDFWVEKYEPDEPKMILFYYHNCLQDHTDRLANTCQHLQTGNESTSVSESLELIYYWLYGRDEYIIF